MAESPPAFLAKDYPPRIVRIAARQVANPSHRSLLYYHAVFDGKACLHKTLIMVGVAVETGKDIGMGILL